ncbi:MAG: carbohydrate kinase [Verrucomicrobiota bacterium]|nr:carbohydrate kinase [Verrucomicrobiota bacterium]
MSKRIVAMGDGLWDLFPDGPRFGGATANFACHTSRLGGEVRMVSGVGKDDRGKDLLAVYRKYGVRTELVQQLSDYPTGTVEVELAEGGMPTFTIGENAAWDHWQWNDEIERGVCSADALYFGTLGQRGESAKEGIRRALAIALERGIPRILDVNLRSPFFDDSLIRDSVAVCSVLKLSDEELDRVARAGEIPSSESELERLKMIREKFGLRWVVMTEGAEGATLVLEKGSVRQPGAPAKVVDTVGAGDSFTAALTIGLLEESDPSEVLETACQVAAEVCSHAGAVPQ